MRVCNDKLVTHCPLDSVLCSMCCGLPAVWHSVSVVWYCSLVKKQSVSALQLSEPAGWSFEFPVV